MRPYSHALLFVVFATVPLVAQAPAAGAQSGAAATFTQRLLTAVSHRDVDTLAGMIRFPVTVRSGSVTIPISSPAALAKAFDTVFTPELGCALERDPQPAGLALGNGAVDVQPAGSTLTITRITQPPGASPAAPRSQPRRVEVPSGQVQFAGNLAVGGADRYLVSLREGDVLQARVERFLGRAIGVRVVDAKSGRRLSTGADAARVATATAPHGGEVAVEVTRLTFCEPSASYLLTLTRRR